LVIFLTFTNLDEEAGVKVPFILKEYLEEDI